MNATNCAAIDGQKQGACKDSSTGVPKRNSHRTFVFTGLLAFLCVSSQSAHQGPKVINGKSLVTESTVKKYELQGIDGSYTGAIEFDVTINDQYDTNSIDSVTFFVDTEGLAFDDVGCKSGSKDWCLDHLRFDGKDSSGEDYPLETSSPMTTKKGEEASNSNERRIYDQNQNAGYFAAAKTAVASGLVKLTVEPSAEAYKVHTVWVKVEYETSEQRERNRQQSKAKPAQ